MTKLELQKKRGFTIERGYDGDYRLQFKHSNLNLTREALEVIKNLGACVVFDDVNGGKAVGGYYASGTITEAQAKEHSLI